MTICPFFFCYCTWQHIFRRFFFLWLIAFVFNILFSSSVLCLCCRCFVKLWGALCLFGKHNGQACAFRVQQVSHTPYSVTILSLFQAFAFHLRVQSECFFCCTLLVCYMTHMVPCSFKRPDLLRTCFVHLI